MSDLSLDDILAEIDKKRDSDGSPKKKSAEFSVDDILGETLGDFPKRKTYSSAGLTVDKKVKKNKNDSKALVMDFDKP